MSAGQACNGICRDKVKGIRENHRLIKGIATARKKLERKDKKKKRKWV